MFICPLYRVLKIVTIIKEKLNKDVIKFRQVATGRATYLSIKNKDYKYNIYNIYSRPIYNIYGPVSGKSEIYINFCKKHFDSTNRNDNCILLGDWNLLLNNSMCSKEISEYHKRKPREVGHHFEE